MQQVKLMLSFESALWWGTKQTTLNGLLHLKPLHFYEIINMLLQFKYFF